MLKALQKCLEALGLQEQKKNEAIREDESQELYEDLLFVAGLMTCQIYFLILCKPVKAMPEAADNVCSFIDSTLLITRLNNCYNKSGTIHTLNLILLQIWQEIMELKSATKPPAKGNQCSNLYKRLKDNDCMYLRGQQKQAEQLPVIKKLVLIVAEWSKVNILIFC